MKKEVKRGARTESLSLRIDPKTKFVLDFMVRVTGFRITDLIEKAIRDYADKTRVGEDQFNEGKNWLHYWHPEEGVRMMNMINDSDLQTNFEEDEIRDFVDQHWEFFYSSPTDKKPLTVFVQVLWPKINDYIEHWRENKTRNRWATGLLMLTAIKEADMQGPNWPRKASAPKPHPVARKPHDDINDDIPF